MLDVITRACRHPFDYSGVCRVTDLELVKQVDEGNDIHSFILKADKLPGWKAGQHSIFTLPKKVIAGKSWRPFSVASAPHEGVIRIGTIISEPASSFKQQLSSLATGGKVRMYGPFGELYIRPGMKKVVGVAGGIGITPFRSIMADLAHKRSPVQLTLIYSAKESHTYRDELEKWCRENNNLQIIYIHTAEEVNAELAKQVEQNKNEAYYLLSGAPVMIEALRESLLRQKIKSGHIFNDPFKGY